MRKSIEDYVQKCDPCQRRKEKGEFVAPLGNQEKPKQPFQVLSIDLTGPYPVTARGNYICLRSFAILPSLLKLFLCPTPLRRLVPGYIVLRSSPDTAQAQH